MKPRILSVLISAFLIFSLAGCGQATISPSQVSSAANSSSASRSAVDTTEKTFTLAELAKFDGQNGNLAYVAVSGVVYDVTNVKQWNSGQHQGVSAGKDLTKEIQNAPHGLSVLKGLQIVGKLK